MKRTSKIYVAGHQGLVGSSIVRKLKENGYRNIITFSHQELDLTDKSQTETMFKLIKPQYVFLAAAKVGGIQANNTQSGDYFYQNIMIQSNVLEAAKNSGVKKLLFLGSSCIYPRYCPQPIKEEYLMTSPLEESNSAYATAKIAGIEMCKAYHKQYGCNFISAMPTNLYGPCFSSDTDILSVDGIKNIKDIQQGDLVYTLNPDTHQIEIEKVTATQKQLTTNEFFNFKNKSINFRVTPDHKMYFKTSSGFVKKKAEVFREKAGKKYGQITFAHQEIKRCDIRENWSFSLRDCIDENHILKNDLVKDHLHSKSHYFPIAYNVADFSEFLGWYISEGSVVLGKTKGGKFSKKTIHGIIQIAQSKNKNPQYYNEIEDLLNRMNIHHKKNDDGFVFSSRLFTNYIIKYIGIGSANKQIPKFFLSESVSNNTKYILFESLMKGDGNKSGERYNTISKKLTRDFIHLSFLLGIKSGSSKTNMSRIGIRQKRKNTTVKYKDIFIEKVNDEPVYCITTEKNHIIYAGRDLKFNWIGQCDNFSLESSHVLPGLIRKFHLAKLEGKKSVELWGDGNPLREFLHVDDLAEALMILMENYDQPGHINIGYGEDVPINFLARLIADIVGYKGKIIWNPNFPNGTPKKLLDSSRIKEMGWEPTISLDRGIQETYKWFLANYEEIRK